MNLFRSVCTIMSVVALTLLPVPMSIARQQRPSTAPVSQDMAAVTNVRVTASNYNGKCSGDVSFTARIEVNGPVTVEYRWITDDGEEGMTSTLVFERAGGKNVYMAIQGVVNAGKKSAKGWGVLNIISPNRLASNKAFYSATCSE